jgi:hypothetical protein
VRAKSLILCPRSLSRSVSTIGTFRSQGKEQVTPTV